MLRTTTTPNTIATTLRYSLKLQPIAIALGYSIRYIAERGAEGFFSLIGVVIKLNGGNTLKSLTLQRKAKEMLDSLNRIDQVTGEDGHTLGRFLCFLATKHPEAAGFTEVGEALDKTKSQISRTARVLHKMSSDGKAGLDLIDIHFDIHNPRIKLVQLNARGVTAVETMLGE